MFVQSLRSFPKPPMSEIKENILIFIICIFIVIVKKKKCLKTRIIGNRKSTDRQHNVHRNKDKKTNTEQQNISQLLLTTLIPAKISYTENLTVSITTPD